MKKIVLLLSLFTLSSYAQDTVNSKKMNLEFDFGLGFSKVKTEKNFPIYGQNAQFNILAEYPLNKNGNIGFVYGLSVEAISFSPSPKMANQSTFIGIPLKIRLRQKKTDSSNLRLFADIGLIASASVHSKSYIEDKTLSDTFNGYNLGLSTSLGLPINEYFYTKLQANIGFTPTTINNEKYHFSNALMTFGYRF